MGGSLRSQSLRRPSGPVTLDGTIIRVDPATGAALPDNPLASHSDPNARRIIAYGLRNPFRFSFRPGGSEMWVGDVGQTTWEEINRITSPTAAAVNFGWPCYEGPNRNSSFDNVDLTICENLYAEAGADTKPYFTYRHADKVVPGESCPVGSSSVSGISFEFAGASNPYPASFDDALYFADYSRDCIWVMKKGANGHPAPGQIETLVADAANPVVLRRGPGGLLYYADFDGGTIRRIEFSAGTGVPVNTAPPTIAGFAGQYQVLNASTGTWTNAPSSYAYQWQRCGSGGSGCAAIAGATTSSYQLQAADVGSTIRVSVTASNGAGSSQPAQSAATAVVAADKAAGHTATASSVEGGTEYPAANAVDGNSATRWSSAADDAAWWQVDLGSLQTVATVVLNWEAAYGSSYKIQVSSNGTTFTDAATASATGPGRVVTSFAATSARYVRFQGITRGTPWGYSFWDANVYGGTGGNQPPTPVIGAPSSSTTWRVGQQISFSGSATDPEDGPVPSTALSWSLVMHHCPSNCHTHPVQTWDGVASGSFSAPDHEYPSHLELILTARDSQGSTSSTSVLLQPRTVQLTLASSPPGLGLSLNSTSAPAPFTQTVIEGSTNSMSAPNQTLGGTSYVFSSWSDGGAQSHNVTANATATYTATFTSQPGGGTTYSQTVLADSPAAYWRLGEASGTSAADSSGNGRTGSYVASPTLGAPGALSESNTAVGFNGSSQYVNVPYAAALNPAQFTVEAWAFITGGQGTHRSLVTSRNYSTNNARGFVLYAAADNTWQFWNGTGPGWGIVYGPPVTLNQWTHVVGTYDGTTMRLYVNGVLVASTAAGYVQNTQRPLRIASGATEKASPQFYLPGRVDEAAVYGSALSAARVQAHFAAASSGGGGNQPPNAVATASPTSGTVPLAVTFNGAGSSDPDGTITAYAWDLDGDGAFDDSTAQSPSHTYSTAATYTVRLQVTDDDGALDVSDPITISATSPGGGSTYSQTVLADSPLAYWRLGEASGSSAADASGNGRTGSYVASPTLGAPGALSEANTAVGFNGSSQYVNVPYTAALNPAQFTVEAWAYVTGGQGTYRSIVTSRDYSTNNARGYVIYAAADNTWQFWDGAGAGWGIVYGPSVTLNQWTHLVGTYDGTTLRLYVNGTLIGATPSGYVQNIQRPLRIATGRTESTPTFYLPGRVDEAAVYGSALSAARVQAHFAAAGSGGGGGNQAPNAVATASPTSGTVPLAVTFNGAGSSDPDGTITAYAWDLDGDGAFDDSTAQSPAHTYTTAASYTVRLQVTDDDGALDVSDPITISATSSGGGSTYSQTVLADSPLAYWRLGETSGTSAADASGNGRTGSYVGAPTLGAPGALSEANTAVGFNGSSQYVNVPYAAALNPAQFTVEGWAFITGGQGTYRSLVTSRDYSTNNARGFVIYAAADNTWQLWNGAGAGWSIAYGPAVTLNQWTHLVGTYDGTTMRLYVNGTLVASTAAGYVQNTQRPLRIATGRTESTPTFYLPGRVDEVAVYASALSEARVQAHFAART
jgi:PKD repeat protein